MVAAVSQSASPEELAGQRRALAGLADLAIPLARWLAVGTLLLVTVIVVSRRLAGGLTGPASAFAVFAVAAAGAGLVSVADRFEPARSPPGGWLVGWFTRGCLLATLAAVGLFWPPSLITVVTAMLMFFAASRLAAATTRCWNRAAPVAPVATVAALVVADPEGHRRQTERCSRFKQREPQTTRPTRPTDSVAGAISADRWPWPGRTSRPTGSDPRCRKPAGHGTRRLLPRPPIDS